MYLLDTNIISELRKVTIGTADASVKAWAARTRPAEMYLSVVSILETEIGILSLERRDALQAAALRKWFDVQVLPSFQDRLLSVDAAVARCAARLHVPNRQPERDALIAATAIVHNMRVVTRNVADFSATGVAIVNPWQAA